MVLCCCVVSCACVRGGGGSFKCRGVAVSMLLTASASTPKASSASVDFGHDTRHFHMHQQKIIIRSVCNGDDLGTFNRRCCFHNGHRFRPRGKSCVALSSSSLKSGSSTRLGGQDDGRKNILLCPHLCTASDGIAVSTHGSTAPFRFARIRLPSKSYPSSMPLFL